MHCKHLTATFLSHHVFSGHVLGCFLHLGQDPFNISRKQDFPTTAAARISALPEVGWLGSLDWLCRNRRVYGVELAEKEDEEEWLSHRFAAPLDATIDPWGHKQLQQHLQSMWKVEACC